MKGAQEARANSVNSKSLEVNAMTDENQEVQTQEVAASAAQNAADSTPQAGGETFDAEYVKQLRTEAAQYRKRLRELENIVKTKEEESLSENERLQKRLAELERKESEYLLALQARTLEYETKLHAAKLGVVDPEVAYKLLDLKQIEFDEDGRPLNVEEKLKELIARKNYLVSQRSSSSPTNPAQGRIGGQQTFTRSQLRDSKFFAAHRDEILSAMQDGRILED